MLEDRLTSPGHQRHISTAVCQIVCLEAGRSVRESHGFYVNMGESLRALLDTQRAYHIESTTFARSTFSLLVLAQLCNMYEP